MTKQIILLGIILIMCVVVKSQSTSVTIPLGGNSWVHNKATNARDTVTENGWEQWGKATAVWSTYFYVAHAGLVDVQALMDVPEGESMISFTINNTSHSVIVRGKEKWVSIGKWNIRNAGYVKLKARGVRRSGKLFANVQSIKLGGSAIDSNTAFVKNNEGNFFYWGRRGPSVHINYKVPDSIQNIEWFYSEITVPKGYDINGSYFMADGFAEGYFGMQVNSPTERRVIFSVWSPFETDDPKQIPENKRIVLMKKGAGVFAEDFGNEGSGGHSHLVYNWKAGQPYKFLLQGKPVADSNTNYTAYFFDNERRQWLLITSFTRPATHTYLKRLHSFLENFDPEQGDLTRKAYYHNQWVKPANGDWLPINNMQFSIDNTGRKGYRLDYSGGVERQQFFLKNGGFFNDKAQPGKAFTSTEINAKPVVELQNLPSE